MWLVEIEHIQDNVLHEALVGRQWKKLALSHVDITEACLKGLEVEELDLGGDIPNLNQLYQTLVGMKEKGLKRLEIHCYRGRGRMFYTERCKDFSEKVDYLSSLKRIFQILVSRFLLYF